MNHVLRIQRHLLVHPIPAHKVHPKADLGRGDLDFRAVCSNHAKYLIFMALLQWRAALQRFGVQVTIARTLRRVAGSANRLRSARKYQDQRWPKSRTGYSSFFGLVPRVRFYLTPSNHFDISCNGMCTAQCHCIFVEQPLVAKDLVKVPGSVRVL